MKHYNPHLINSSQKVFNFKGGENIEEVAEFIQPVKEILPRLNFVNNTQATSTGTLSLGVPSTGDFYLYGLSYSLVKDAVCDQATGRININVTVDGTTRTLWGYPIITLTAQSINVVLRFDYPLRLDRSSTISQSSTYTVGVQSRTMEIQAYWFSDVTTNGSQ